MDKSQGWRANTIQGVGDESYYGLPSFVVSHLLSIFKFSRVLILRSQLCWVQVYLSFNLCSYAALAVVSC